jgi:hypothetical protein
MWVQHGSGRKMGTVMNFLKLFQSEVPCLPLDIEYLKGLAV